MANHKAQTVLARARRLLRETANLRNAPERPLVFKTKDNALIQRPTALKYLVTYNK